MGRLHSPTGAIIRWLFDPKKRVQDSPSLCCLNSYQLVVVEHESNFRLYALHSHPRKHFYNQKLLMPFVFNLKFEPVLAEDSRWCPGSAL